MKQKIASLYIGAILARTEPLVGVAIESEAASRWEKSRAEEYGAAEIAHDSAIDTRKKGKRGAGVPRLSPETVAFNLPDSASFIVKNGRCNLTDRLRTVLKN